MQTTARPMEGSNSAQEEFMRKLVALLLAATFATVSFQAVAQDKAKKPTAEECKKDPKMKGCEEMKKK